MGDVAELNLENTRRAVLGRYEDGDWIITDESVPLERE